MRRLLRHSAYTMTGWVLCVACAVSPVFGQTPTQPPVRRLNGVLHHNETWSGTIIITDDLLIDGATITVAPGTIVEFADARPNHHPKLTVGSPTEQGGHLDILATVDSPVVFRTRRGTNPGRIIVNIRPKAVMSQSPVHVTDSTQAADREPRDVSWQHVVFEDLGYRIESPRGKSSKGQYAPALTFVARGAAHTLGVAKCTFRNSAGLRVDVADNARITLLSNEFTRSKGRLNIEVRGDSDVAGPPVQILRQRLPGIIRTGNAAVHISDCLLIGEHAAIVIGRGAPRDIEISNNYIHNTTGTADGHYCLNCGDPNAVIRGNILRGGTTCVYNGSFHMSRNVLIAAGRLVKPGTSREITQTAYLVRSLPPGAIFEHNLLLGPALSLICPQPLLRHVAPKSGKTTATVLRNNVFDGFSRTPRALHLNAAGVSPVPLELYNNVFVRIRLPVFDESGRDEPFAYADHNGFAPPPPSPPRSSRSTEDANPEGPAPSKSGLRACDIGMQPHDVRANHVGSLTLRAVPAVVPDDFEKEIRAGLVKISEVRDRLLDGYATTPESPLFGSGRRTDSAGDRPTSIGL